MKAIILTIILFVTTQLISGQDIQNYNIILIQTKLKDSFINNKPAYNHVLKSYSSINYCDYVNCKIYAQDDENQFLGITSQNIYDNESIINPYGNYGSEYSQTSIRNTYSTYGSEYSNYSPYNEYATKPPILYKFNSFTQVWEIAAYLTKNTYLSTGIHPILDPDVLIYTLESVSCFSTPINNPPLFLSTAITTATQNIKYDYNIITTDINGDTLVITAPIKPEWLTFIDYGNGTALLSGTPTSSHIGAHNVKIKVNDGTVSVDQDFVITVSGPDINHPPTFTSIAVTSAKPNIIYVYGIEATDADGDAMTITAPTIPEWLTLTDYGFGLAILSGTPTSSYIGTHNVKIRVNDGTVSVDQDFMITVSGTNNMKENYSSNFKVFPNPFSRELNILILRQDIKDVFIRVYDITGQMKLYEIVKKNSHNEIISVPLEFLRNGLYILEVQKNGENYRKLILKE